MQPINPKSGDGVGTLGEKSEVYKSMRNVLNGVLLRLAGTTHSLASLFIQEGFHKRDFSLDIAMAPQTGRSLMGNLRASFRRKKVVVDPTPKPTSSAREANEDELAKLAEMKENLGDNRPPQYTDADLLSFLRARSLNVKDAEKLMKIDENSKRILRVSEYVVEKELLDYCYGGIIGFDKEGSLVRVFNVGGADTKGLMHRISTLKGLRIILWMLAQDRMKVENENKKTGRKNCQFVLIVNLENLSMAQVTFKPAFDSIMMALKLLQDHFHDILRSVIFINAPSFFSSVFKLFKPVIQESLQEKIKIYDQSGSWKEELLNQIDENILPQYLGGKKVDSNGDPNCSEYICFGGTVPESLYANNFLDPEDPEVVLATVAAGSILNFRFPVRQVGSVLKYHIQAQDNDIGVGLFREPFLSGTETPRTRKKKEEDMSRFEQLTPIIRCQCHICPEEGQAILWQTGNFILHFDNTYSWMNSKEVLFKISISPPTAAEKNYINSLEETTRNLKKMALSR